METHANSALVAHLWTPDLAHVRIAVLVVLLLLAAAIDVRSMRVPNWLTAGGALLGLVLAAAVPWQWLGPVWAVEGLLWSLAGMGVGLVLLLPLYLLRVLGAGDVKLMAMVGAFVGIQQILPAALCVFVAGGVIALAWSLYRRLARRLGANTADVALALAAAVLTRTRPALPLSSLGRLPYAIAIATGTLAWLALTRVASR